ncbi:anthranilate phosphoribosyltransferase [Gammaproteobacteria bacterium]|nr:anthranilate phosphoribosyltransferase [Gammaproteobacteria bacterium]
MNAHIDPQTTMQIMQELMLGCDLSSQQAAQLFLAMLNNELGDIEKTAILVALKVKGETSAEISGAAMTLRAQALPFSIPDYQYADIVGTGGDGVSTINISTAVSFVAAAAGLPIVKHGNRAVSSKCGAADLLENFGVNLNMHPNIARKALDEAGVSFLFAPKYHESIKQVMHVRKTLATRTIFNILGPLISPAKPPIMLVGVYDPALCDIFAKTLRNMGCKRALVVNGLGLDEIAIHGRTNTVELINGEIIPKDFKPADFGVSEFPLSSIIGGNPFENASFIKNVLEGHGKDSHCAAIGVNAAALLYLADKVDNLAQGYELARDTMQSGKAAVCLSKLVEISNMD